ncbi:bifunctional diguanylate cyclase/phosphodiesterase [Clostridium sp. AN503]|uniref:putative bifunctional diguanylate cyclase/phosphodiesterase n=1 Tax=Clostridium sp. AN503 TaxID=3160598 RepID=UPI00345AE56E
MAAISGNKNTSIYVIDDEYRLVYFNQVLQEKYPQAKTGDFCYERLCGEKQPCQVCPLARKSGSETLYYNRLMKCWINIGTGDLAWPGKDRCHIILATSIHEDDALYEELLNPLTGLYKRGAFFQKGEEFLDEASEGRYCLVAIDIEHFKLFNDWYGQKEGDKLLVDIGRRLLQLQQEGKGVAGYIGGDDFAILMPDDAEEICRIQASLTEYVKAYGENAGFLPTFGVYEIEEREHSLSAMYDRAVIAANSIKGNYAQRICYYDRRMKQRMEEDHLLLSEVQRGMENGEFVFYTQPKCDLSTGRIVGLEALVRWNHSVRGVISPGTFLPLLESNGLITNLDIFIWESVCKKVRSWIDQGRQPIPISVNVSCVDIFAIDVVETFRQLVKRYDLEPRLIEIEITESAYVERFDEVIRIVEALRSAGFTVLMDDFGSGYSSLNMLKDVSVDILKIDMKFLDLNENSLGRGVSILEAIAKMAHIMGLKLIAEGVETKEQVEFLLNVGCSYGQGYYFYRPMPPMDMEDLIVHEENVDYRGITLQKMEPVRMRDLFNEDVLSDTMAGNILGAAAFTMSMVTGWSL